MQASNRTKTALDDRLTEGVNRGRDLKQLASAVLTAGSGEIDAGSIPGFIDLLEAEMNERRELIQALRSWHIQALEGRIKTLEHRTAILADGER